MCVGVVGHLHGPALLFGGAFFRDQRLGSVCEGGGGGVSFFASI